MSENVFSKIKGLFSNKHHEEKRIQRQKEEHDVLKDAIEQPIVKRPSEVMIIQENLPERKSDANIQSVSKNEILEQESKEIVSKKKDYKSIYKKYMKNVSDKDDFSNSIYSDDEESEEIEDSNEKLTEDSNENNRVSFKKEIVKESEDKSFKNTLEANVSKEQPKESEEYKEQQENTKENIIESKSHELSDKEINKDNYEFLTKKQSVSNQSSEEQSEPPKLKKFFENKDPPITTGLNRFRDTSEGYEFLNKKEISKPKNKPNYNKVNY
jgi:hypothetical protein